MVKARVGADSERTTDVGVNELDGGYSRSRGRRQWCSIQLAKKTWFTDRICFLLRLQLHASDNLGLGNTATTMEMVASEATMPKCFMKGQSRGRRFLRSLPN